MPFYPFNTSIPDTNNDPGDDQPDMKNNNISTNSLVAEDHYSFNDINGGYHKFATFIAQGSATVPFAGTSGVLFGKIVNADAWPHWLNSSGSAIPLITGRPKSAANGYTYLPGNILLQWGIVTPNANGSTTVTFATSNVNFNTTPYTIFLQPFTTAPISSSTRILAVVDTKTATNFSFILFNNVTVDSILWMAIGESII